MNDQLQLRFHAPGRPSRMECARKILDRLRQGPATSKQLADYTGAMNWRARISDLRKLGAVILCTRHPRIRNVNVYTLLKELPDHPDYDGAPDE
jgi:hypothetical protein